MADKKILLFAVLLLAACTADPAMDGADGGNSSANTAAAAKLINTPYDAKQGSLIVCFDDAAVPTIEATAASFAATRGDAGDAAVLTRSGIAPVDEVLQGLEITSLRRVFPYTPRHEERTRAAGLHKWYVVTFDEQADLEAAALKLAAVAEVRNVEFNTKLYVTSVGPRRPLTAADMAATRAAAAGRFNDPQLSRQWHYNNNGDKTVASTSRAGADINAQDAWAITAGNPGVVVAIVDQGVKYTHPDLAANMWINTQEKNGATGADDDGNGYIDDIYGYNFVTRGAVSWDREVWVGGENKGDSGHGTHVAGTVAAVNNNGVGVCGVAGGAPLPPKPSSMPPTTELRSSSVRSEARREPILRTAPMSAARACSTMPSSISSNLRTAMPSAAAWSSLPPATMLLPCRATRGLTTIISP